MNVSLFIICVALSLQLLAAFVALRLIIHSKKRIAGVLMLVTTLLMTFRRFLSLNRLIAEGEAGISLPDELTGCLVSIMLVIGFLYLSRLIPFLQQKIEEHTLSQKILQDANAKLRTLIQAIPDAVYFKDPSRRYLMVNKAFERFTGEAQSMIVGKTDEDLLPPDIAEIRKKSDEKSIQGRVPVLIEDTMTGKDGIIRIFDCIKAPIYDAQGALLGIVGVSRDVTEHKKAEERVAQLSHRNELILNSAGEGIYGLDVNGNTTFANPAAAKMIGWEPHELIGKQQHNILHHSKPDGSPYAKDQCKIYAAFEEGKVYHVDDEVFWRKDGTCFPVEYTSTPIWEDGKPAGAVVVYKDISERKQVETLLKAALFSAREEKAKSDSIIAAIGDGLVILDEEFRIIFQNETITKMIGSHVGKICYKAGEGRNVVCENCPVELSFRDGLVHRMERTRTTNHSIFHMDITSSPIRDSSGKIVAVIELVRDITDRKKAEGVLMRSRDELESLVEKRAAELKTVNEQLRNLSGHLQNARESERTAIAREIHDELGQLLTALKMDFSVLRKRLPGDRKSVMEKADSIDELIEITIQNVKRISTDLRPGILDHLGLIAAIEWQAEEFEKRTGVRCAVSIETEKAGLDKDRATMVFRVFQEALTNVARHAKATEVSVLLTEQADWLTLQVEDNGVGITEMQTTDPRSLGLIGMRERVYSCGGLLSIRGARNAGTTMTVQVPLAGNGGRL